jgi:transposase-like protein
MAKYTPENKLEVVKSILGDRISFGEAARKYHVDKGDVQKWVAVYHAHGIAGLAKQRISYPGKFEQKVIEDMRANKLSHTTTILTQGGIRGETYRPKDRMKAGVQTVPPANIRSDRRFHHF